MAINQSPATWRFSGGDSCSRCAGPLPAERTILDPVLRGRFMCVACTKALLDRKMELDPRPAEKARLLAEWDNCTAEDWDRILYRGPLEAEACELAVHPLRKGLDAAHAQVLEVVAQRDTLAPIAERAERTRKAQADGGRKGSRAAEPHNRATAEANRKAVARAARAGRSQREATRELNLDRKTVRKYWPSKK